MLSIDKISLHYPVQFGFDPWLWIVVKWHLGREKGRSGVTCCCEILWFCCGNMALLWLWITLPLSDPLCLFLAAQLPVTSRHPTHKHKHAFILKTDTHYSCTLY